MSKPRTYSSLAAYLKGTGQTQEQFAAVVSRRMGRTIRQSQISQWVSGEATPRLTTALLLAEITGLPVASIARSKAKKVAA